MPMFPLGTVLFPYAVQSLHVFEPRYRQLVETCLQTDGRFGIVLIERGHEVGGGDTRFDVGTVARIGEAARTPDGRYLLEVVGAERCRVKRWLTDEPYPRADVELVREPKKVSADVGSRCEPVERMLVRVSALLAELGERAVPVDAVRLDADPVRASFEAAAMAPIGPLDAQGLLAVDDPGERLDRVQALLADATELLQHQLGQG